MVVTVTVSVGITVLTHHSLAEDSKAEPTQSYAVTEVAEQ